MWSTNHHTKLYILVFCVWVIVLAGIFYLIAKPVRDASRDFLSYYIAASAIHQGKPLYTLETYESVAGQLDIKTAGLYLYPPTFAVLIQPALLLSPHGASLLWFGVNVLLLLIGVALLLRQNNLRNRQIKFVLLLLPVLFTPVLMNFYLGQVNIILFILIVLVWLTFVRGRRYTSGVLLALSVWIKIWPIILIAYFAWKREWKVVIGALVGLLLIGVLTLALAGVGQTTSFFTDRFPELVQGTEPGRDHLNQSIPGVFAKLFAPSSKYVYPLIWNPTLAQQGSRIVTLLLIVASVILCSRPIALKDGEQFSTELMLVVIATMLITGRLFESNLALLLLAYFFIAEQLQREHIKTWRQIALPIVSIILIDIHRVIWTLANPDKQALPWFLLIFPFIGLMLLWLNFALRRIREVKTLRIGDLGETAELTQSTGAP